MKSTRDQPKLSLADAEAILRREADFARIKAIGGITGVEIIVAEGLTGRPSNAYKMLHGLSRDVVTDTYEDWLGRVHPGDRERVSTLIASAVNGADAGYEVEYRIVRPSDGVTRWILERIDIERDSSGRAIRLVGAEIDITAQKEQEMAVRVSEERLRTLADEVPQIIWTNDSRGSANYFNRRWYEYSGLSFDESVELGWQAIVHPEDAPASVDRWHAALASGKTFDTEYRLRSGDGMYRWFIGRNVPLRDADGHVQGWFGSATEIEALKLAQEAAHASEARLRVTMESAIDYAIVTLDTQGMIVAWSAGAQLAFGYRDDEAIGQSGDILFTPEDRANDIPAFERERALGLGRADDERWHLRRDGTRFFMSGVMSPIYDHTLMGFVKVARDMTERRQAQEALVQSEARYRVMAEDLSRTKEALIAADRQKDQFIATLAHELRNPLAPVRSAMQLISMAGSHDPHVLWALEVVNRQTNNMTRLIDDLMDVSRITQNKLTLRTGPVDLSTVLRDAMDISRPLTEQQSQSLIVHLPPRPIEIHGDQTRLAQVFANLLDNAAKYTEPGGTITVTVTVEDSAVQVSVRDTGIGIAQEHRTRIFDLFSQVRTSRDRAKGGLGIGLSLVQELVHMHGGTITVQSEGEGCGSEFVVRLPMVASAQSATIAEETDLTVDEDALQGLRVLVVDDNVDAADAFRVLFARRGCEVRVAYDGETAFATAEEFRPDIVLMDIGLPKLTGHEVAARIRNQEWGRRVVLLAISGWGSDEEKRRSYAAGFDRHLVKPVDPGKLMSVMAELVKEQGARQ